MVDNVTIPATGSGTATPVVATDDIGGVHHQLMKVEWGPADTANQVDTASGKPLPVQIRGSAGGDLVKLEDGAAGDGDPGIPILVKRQDTPAANANVSADADYAPLLVDNLGQLWVAGAYKEDQASADGDRGIVILAKRAATPADTSGTDGDYEPIQVKDGRVWTHPIGDFVTVTTSVTRIATTTTYTANDNWSDSSTAPTAGGFTFTSVGRVSGGSGIITDVMVISDADPALTLQGELWITDGAFATNDNDNAAFTCADADSLLLVAVIPFTLASTVAGSGTNSYAHVQNLNIGFTTVGSANLRFKIKVKNAYIPVSGEKLTARLKIIQTT